MLSRNQVSGDAVQVQNSASDAPVGGNLDQVRQVGESLFRAADDAIRRALSRDSRAFLESTQQSGGQ